MIVSSRTPEGRPNHCPLCDKDLVLEPSLPFGDAPCPHCGQLLWFMNVGSETRYFKNKSGEPIEPRLVQLVAEQLGIPVEELLRRTGDADLSFFDELRMDSLDVVELVMELEDESDL